MAIARSALSDCPVTCRRPIIRSSSRFAAYLFLGLSGCGNSNQGTEPATPIAHRASASFEVPLTEKDVRTFLDIVRDLPEGTAPDFEPASGVSVDDRLPAASLVSAYRREYRRLFDPVEQGSRWRRDAQLMTVLAAHGIEPEEFAALMTRIGCALASRAVSSRLNLAEAAEKADRQLQEIITRIEQWDQRAADGTATSSRVIQRRQPLVDQLKDLVALAEFSRILMNVPADSRVAIEGYQQELAAHLPRSGDMQLFERTLDAEAVIVPVQFQQTE